MKKIYTGEKKCEYCGKKFKRNYGEGIRKWNKRKFCSHECYWKDLKGSISRKRTGEIVKCKVCGKEFYRANKGGNQKFCSWECYQKYHRAKKKVRCKICGEIFETNKANKAKYCSRKCYNVDRYYSETKVIRIAREFLKNNGEREKAFEDLIGDKGGKLRFDVYFEKYNLAIEYNGEQHYNYVKKFSNRPLETVQRSDFLKREYCRKKGIKLLVVKYNQKITYKNIINLIKRCLKK